ncbi:hypothetical protein G4B88_029014 [Cannabis sativa]|uniref:Uncharacterized protein n=1 Tax=Cannabis sativa TaxID=3483 RepID=A0A7J6HQV7_CANSA|nr:hypothetical protein G4B88_029014 [Cannabis sativa]
MENGQSFSFKRGTSRNLHRKGLNRSPWSSKERIARKASVPLIAASTKILTKDPDHSLSKPGTTIGCCKDPEGATQSLVSRRDFITVWKMDSGVANRLSWKVLLRTFHRVNTPSKWRVKDPIQNLSCRSKGEKIATNPPRTLKPAVSSHMTVEKQVFHILTKDTTRRITKQSIEPLATRKDVLAHFPHKKFNRSENGADFTEKLPSSELFQTRESWEPGGRRDNLPNCSKNSGSLIDIPRYPWHPRRTPDVHILTIAHQPAALSTNKIPSSEYSFRSPRGRTRDARIPKIRIPPTILSQEKSTNLTKLQRLLLTIEIVPRIGPSSISRHTNFSENIKNSIFSPRLVWQNQWGPYAFLPLFMNRIITIIKSQRTLQNIKRPGPQRVPTDMIRSSLGRTLLALNTKGIVTTMDNPPFHTNGAFRRRLRISITRGILLFHLDSFLNIFSFQNRKPIFKTRSNF